MTEPLLSAKAGPGSGVPPASTRGPRPVRADAVARVQGLTVRFRDTDDPPAVDDVSFSISGGEVLALVGESGSGKTVTALALLGLLPASAAASGSVQLTDAPLARPAHEQPNLLLAGEAAWRGVRGHRVAMIFQEPQTALNPVRSVGWQIAEALRAQRSLSRAQIRARVVELLELVGIEDAARRARDYPHQLSGGQKQRVVIALALAGEPTLLIADEPTTALDVTVQAEILHLLVQLRDRLDMAILLITHNMGVVASMADRVLVMRRGRMVERGEVVSLFVSPFTPYTRELLAAVPRLPEPGTVRAGDAPSGTEQPETPSRSVLELDRVTLDYPGRLGRPAFRALHAVSVAVGAGRVVGVVGESGSGKSTLAKAATGQLPLSDGWVCLLGQQLGTIGPRQLRGLRAGLGVIHQDPATTLDPLLSVGDSVAEPLVVHRQAAGADLRRRVRRLLDDVGLPEKAERRLPHELSGGQRQRVALARALALRPALLVADEPTSALDVTVQASILRLFADLQAEFGFACLFISHDLAVINEVSDQVLVLRHGQAVEFGTAGEVLTRPQSPYTQALLDAVPIPDPLGRRGLRRLIG